MPKNSYDEAQYILLVLYWDDSDDYESHWCWELETEFYRDSQLKDLSKIMKDHAIKKWASIDVDPSDFDKWGDKDKRVGMLLQARPITIKPMKVVTSWGYSHPTYEGDN
jgi:hypothetical protein